MMRHSWAPVPGAAIPENERARRPAALPYPNAHYWFALVLVVLIVGFWESYFAQLGQGTVDVPHHVHGIAMLLWVLMLIGQSWLVGARKFGVHRMVGRCSLVLAPLIVFGGIWVTVYNLRPPMPSPIPAPWIGAFTFGFFQMLAFAVLYALAIRNRGRVQLHARYMAATALVFLPPGLARAWASYLEPVPFPVPGGALGVAAVPLLLALVLLGLDLRRKDEFRPYAVFAGLWVVGLTLRVLLPQVGAWQDFADWTVRIQS